MKWPRCTAGEKPGYTYTRYGNPTVHALEEKLAALEAGEAALAFGSGMAAISSAILGYVKAGDHVVAARSLYGATYDFLNRMLPALGASATFVQSTRSEDFEKAIQPNTRLIYLETPSNPVLDILDIAELARIAQCAQDPFHDRQHFCLTGPSAAPQVGYYGRGPRRHQVPVRAR